MQSHCDGFKQRAIFVCHQLHCLTQNPMPLSHSPQKGGEASCYRSVIEPQQISLTSQKITFSPSANLLTSLCGAVPEVSSGFLFPSCKNNPLSRGRIQVSSCDCVTVSKQWLVVQIVSECLNGGIHKKTTELKPAQPGGTKVVQVLLWCYSPLVLKCCNRTCDNGC